MTSVPLSRILRGGLVATSVVFALASCGKASNDPSSPSCTNRNTPEISVVTDPPHGHTQQGFVCEEDRGNGVLVPLRAISEGVPHTHEYMLDEDQVRMILDGEWVRVFTDRNQDHFHTIVYNPEAM